MGKDGKIEEADEFQVKDRRHWQQAEGDEADEAEEAAPARPSIIGEYEQRAELAERKLQEYIEAYKAAQAEQEQFRERLLRDVDRRVELKLGEVLTELLSTLDDLDLAVAHADGVPEATSLAEGVILARDRFLAALERHGVDRITVDGQPFDPNESEAIRVDSVNDKEQDGRVTATLQPGYRLNDRVIRAARVAVGRYQGQV